MNKSLRIGRKPHTEYRPKRGNYSIVLNSRIRVTRDDVSLWLNNLGTEPLLMTTSTEHPVLKKAEEWFTSENKEKHKGDGGAALITHLFKSIKKDSASKKARPGVLASLGGTFGQDDNDASEMVKSMSVPESSEAITLANIDNDTNSGDNYDDYIDGAFRGLKGSDNVANNEYDESTPPPLGTDLPVSASSILSGAKKNIIAAGMVRIEKACGSSQEKAASSAKKTAELVEKSMEFPSDPTPDIKDASRTRYKSLVDQLIKNSKKDEDG